MNALQIVFLSLFSLCCVISPAQEDGSSKTSVAPASASLRDVPGTTLKQLQRLVNTGHADEALRGVQELRKQASALSGLSRMEGLAFYAKGDLRAADDSFARALQEDAGDVESAQMRGLTLFRLGRPAEAIPLLGSPGTQRDGKADSNYVLGLCYMDTRRYDEARRAFAAQYGFAPESASAYLLSARMMLRREFLPIAKTYAEKALALEPDLPLAHELLGEIALAGNHLDEAIAAFEAEKQRNPLEGMVYDRLGDAYVRAARYDEAQRSLEQAVLLEPNATGPYILLGKTLLKKGDAVGALTYLEHANKLDPANYMTHSLLAQSYRAMGRREEAGRENEMAEKLQAQDEPKLATLR